MRERNVKKYLKRKRTSNNSKDQIKVMFSFFSTPTVRGDNPYFGTLIQNLQSSHSIQAVPWSIKSLMTPKIDVIHIQWADFLVKGPNPLKNLYKRTLTVAILLRAKITGIPIVRTVHNLAPHEGVNLVEGFLLKLIDNATDFRILLNESSENKYENAVVFLHPRYQIVVKTPRTLNPSHKILAFGLIRPYKGFEGLVNAFRIANPPNGQLLIAGKPATQEYGLEFSELVSGSPNVTFRPEFLPEEELQQEIIDADLIVLPYKNVYNSGAAILALSLGVPILITRSPSTESLQDEVGKEWVYLFKEPLTHEDLKRAHNEAKIVRSRGLKLDLDRRAPMQHAKMHAELYRAFQIAKENDSGMAQCPNPAHLRSTSIIEHSVKNSHLGHEK